MLQLEPVRNKRWPCEVKQGEVPETAARDRLVLVLSQGGAMIPALHTSMSKRRCSLLKC